MSIYLKKRKNQNESKSEEDETLPITGKDIKPPFNMKSFWSNINEKYFRKIDDFSPNEVNHLVNLFSKHGYKLNLNI